MSVQNTESAIKQFEEAALNHSLATKKGDYRKANAAADLIRSAYIFLKEHDSVDDLVGLLEHNAVEVRVWAASKLLRVREKEATRVLEEISSGSGISALDAAMVLSEWRSGNLDL